MAIEVTPPFKEFTDLSGAPLDNGYIYIGTENLNPEVNLISIYWDSAMTIPASNPLRTISGYPARNGSPARIYCGAQYSITVKDRSRVLVYSSLSGNLGSVVSYVDSVSNLSTLDNTNTASGTVIVKDLDRGGTFIWSSTGTANGGTVFAGATGFWTRQYSGAVNVKWFGAKGDGVTDDTVSIQRAIDTGFQIETSDGYIYLITETITIQNQGQTISFNGSELKLNDSTGLKSNIKIGDGITQVNGVELNNITFTRSQLATAGYAIETDYVGVLKVKNCRIYGDNKIFSGIKLYKSVIANIENNYIQNCVSNGIYLEGINSTTLRTVDTTIINNRIEGGTTAIDCYDFVEGFFCRNNILFNTSSSALSINASSNVNGLYSFKIQQNDFDTCGGYGIYIDAVSNIQITDNWVSNISGPYACGIKSLCGSVIISDNQIYPSISGILVEGVSVSIADNLISGGSGSILVLGSTAIKCTAVNNKLIGGAYAFDFVTGFDGGAISQNNLSGQSLGTTNNLSGATNLIYKDNKGDAAIGVTSFITVGASPYTYTSGSRPEMISVFGGTVSNIQTGGNSIGFTSNRTVILAPNTAITVTYSSVPFMSKTYL